MKPDAIINPLEYSKIEEKNMKQFSQRLAARRMNRSMYHSSSSDEDIIIVGKDNEMINSKPKMKIPFKTVNPVKQRNQALMKLMEQQMKAQREAEEKRKEEEAAARRKTLEEKEARKMQRLTEKMKEKDVKTTYKRLQNKIIQNVDTDDEDNDDNGNNNANTNVDHNIIDMDGSNNSILSAQSPSKSIMNPLIETSIQNDDHHDDSMDAMNLPSSSIFLLNQKFSLPRTDSCLLVNENNSPSLNNKNNNTNEHHEPGLSQFFVPSLPAPSTQENPNVWSQLRKGSIEFPSSATDAFPSQVPLFEPRDTTTKLFADDNCDSTDGFHKLIFNDNNSNKNMSLDRNP